MGSLVPGRPRCLEPGHRGPPHMVRGGVEAPEPSTHKDFIAADYHGKGITHLTNRMRKMGFSNLVSKVYADTRHESLNELNRDIIMNDFVAWADGVLK